MTAASRSKHAGSGGPRCVWQRARARARQSLEGEVDRTEEQHRERLPSRARGVCVCVCARKGCLRACSAEGGSALPVAARPRALASV
eukprot:6106195-Pleurochrysis_carterae.AAC.1